MARRTVLSCLAAAAVLAGCGAAEDDGDVARVKDWRGEVLYLPPPAPSAAKSQSAQPAPRAEPDAPASSDPAAARGAPSDAEVEAELKEAFKTSGGAGDIVDAASLTTADLATIPPGAPAKVAAMINAANQVARKPYVYGGGHGGGPEGVFTDSAYDCSGSVSYALASAGFIDSPMDSTLLAKFGKPGPGKWVTIYANAGHAFMYVAGLRFDTSGRAERGSRWQTAPRNVNGFTVRHPPGL
jgi:cell wall-associated NlpC family hydrolase